MKAEQERTELEKVFQLVPVKGLRDVYRLKFNLPPRTPEQKEMTEEDWDKFERDIEDAFEQVP